MGMATDLEGLMGGPVVLWGFGHTHLSSDEVINGTRVVSNQLGYITHDEETGFNSDMYLEIEP